MAAKLAKVPMEATAQFLYEQIAITERFGGALGYLLLKPLADGRVMVHAQEALNFVVMNCTSLKPLQLPHPARFDNLGYLKALLDLVQKNMAKGKNSPLVFETKTASDQKTTVIKTIGFDTATGSFQFNASDPFLSKTKVSATRITEWPVEIPITPAHIEQFEDASRTHLAGALKAEDQEFFRLHVKDGEISVRFESRAGKINHTLGTTTAAYQGETVYNISQFRSVLSALGPDGGILKIAEQALSMETETTTGLYTFVLSKKILR